MAPLASWPLYRYVGPAEIAARCAAHPRGHAVRDLDELRRALRALGGGERRTTTFVVDGVGILRVADRASEHVACAGGGPILAAGELTVTSRGEVIEVTNLSTGFCPEPAAWPALVAALDAAGLARPEGWSTAFELRRCPGCGARAVVKDDDYECVECGTTLPAAWNFERARCRRSFVRLARSWMVDVIEEASTTSQDRVALELESDALVLALADGAGGSAGGTRAAERAVELLSRASAEDPGAAIQRLDAELAQVGGECTAVLARLVEDRMTGASVGDSQLHVRRGGAWEEVTEGQGRKPLVGTGRAQPRSFRTNDVERVLCASDGLTSYARWERVCALLERDAPSLPWELLDAARLPSGALQDDVCIVLVRPLPEDGGAGPEPRAAGGSSSRVPAVSGSSESRPR